MYAKYHLKGSETRGKQIHLYKKKLGHYNIVLYPKTGKIYFQNVCLLKCLFLDQQKEKSGDIRRESGWFLRNIYPFTEFTGLHPPIA